MTATMTKEERVRIFIDTGKWPQDVNPTRIPDSPDPKFDSKICPHCGVPFVMNKNRGDIDRDGNEDGFFKVCPLCGMCPY